MKKAQCVIVRPDQAGANGNLPSVNDSQCYYL